MKEQKTIVLPKQPFFVLATDEYYKAPVLKYGISHFYAFEAQGEPQRVAVAVPDGSVDILFCCDKEHPWANVCGTVLHPHQVFHQRESRFFGVRFLPGVIPAFCNATMAELLEKEVALQEVIADKGLLERIAAAGSFEEQQRIFMESYMKFYIAEDASAVREHLNTYLLETIIHTAGSVTVADLAEDTGYSERYVNKVFKECYGVVPKLYCKLMRFQYLLDNMNLAEEGIDFATLSLDMGFYDQSHMIKNFKDFTATTPQKYYAMMKKERFNNRLIVVEKGCGKAGKRCSEIYNPDKKVNDILTA